jgi:hypothetical protein
MKTRMLNTLASAILVLMCFAVMLSCRSEELTLKRKMFYENTTQKNFNLEDQVELNELITILAKEKNEINIVEDAEVVDLTDSQGDFKAISVQYQAGEKITRMIVPVEIVANAKGRSEGSYSVPAESCIMKFSGRQTEACTYEIIERCKSLAISGTGSTSVTFSDNKNYSANMPKGTSDFIMRLR